MTARVTLAVGICTYRRAHLADTLASLGAQRLPDGVDLAILVADNDDAPSARAVVQAFTPPPRMTVTHLHAPGANVSLARNAVLEEVRRRGLTDLAFLDDDEVASPGWIAALWQRRAETGAEAVLGPVRAIYHDTAPGWMARAALHDTTPEFGPHGAPQQGYTGNVLLNLAAPALRDLRFEVARGRTGGEDTAYFRAALALGARLAYAPDALVEEEVPEARAQLGWLLHRRYRTGQTHASLSHPAPALRRLRAAGVAAAKALGALLLALPRLGTAEGRARALMRAALHVGTASAHLGARAIEPYAPPGSALAREVSP